MRAHSPNARQLAVPGIGFPQHISVGLDGIDLRAFGSGRTTGWMPGGALTGWPSVACITMVKRLIQATLMALSSAGR
jgi:hypothetical protein